MMSKIRSNIEYLEVAYNILVLILYTKLIKKSSVTRSACIHGCRTIAGRKMSISPTAFQLLCSSHT